MSFFRYPGGKKKLAKFIIPKINSLLGNDSTIKDYREPFFGGGSIGLKLIEQGINNLWINDFDYAIYSLWHSVINNHERLKRLILDFVPSVDQFYFVKSALDQKKPDFISDDDKVLYGFYKIVIHQISYSGLGMRSGGPLGGKNQKSKYNISCRWSPDHMCKKIDYYHELFSSKVSGNLICSCSDFSGAIIDEEKKAIIYLDPPYYIKGNELYQFGFSEEDHSRLADVLSKTKHYWVLSYDLCDEVEVLYKDWANIEYVSDVKYSINTSRGKTELLISNF